VLRLAVSRWALPGTAGGSAVCSGLFRLVADVPGLIVWPIQWLAGARCPTLQSTGRHPASRVPPVISNVGHHGSFAMFSLLRSFRSKSKCEHVCVKSRRRLQGNALLFAQHRGLALKNAALVRAGSLRLACAGQRPLGITRSFGFCMSVVGASRRSAAPGGQAVGAAGYGSSRLSLCRGAVVIGGRRSRPYRLASPVARQRAMPNPSINRTCPGKPGHAGYLKR